MYTAFIDESYATMPDGRFFMIVVGVITPFPRSIELRIRRLRKQRNISNRSDLHASSAPDDFVEKLLEKLSEDRDASIVAVAWEGERQKIEDHEYLYRLLMARCAQHIVRQYRRVDLCLDKSYTNKHSQRELERSIREAIAEYSDNVVQISQEDSQRMKELLAPDCVAWAYSQHYCRGQKLFYNIIKSKVTIFDNVSE